MRTFNVSDKLGGIFGKRVDVGKAEAQIAEAMDWMALREHRSWHRVESLLAELEHDCMKVLRRNNPEEIDIRRANNRLECLHDIRSTIESRIKTGADAQKQLPKETVDA